MSFFSGNFGDRVPGRIIGNPLNGLCERVCIHTEKVFDAGVIQEQINGELLTLVSNNPPNPAQPLTFVSAANSNFAPATITNLQVERITGRPNYAHVSGDVLIPMTVQYTDANGVAGSGNGMLDVPINVILFVPSQAIISPQVNVTGSCMCPVGTYVGNNVFSVDACVNIVVRITAPVDLLVPSYGYCFIPRAVQFNDNICAGFFDQSLFPEPVRPIPRV